MESVKNFIKFWSLPILYAILIFWSSSLEEPIFIEPEFRYSDKLIHLLEYAVFGFLLIKAIRGSAPEVSIKNAIALTFIVSSFYGFTDELHQSVVSGRFACIYDFMFDCLGVFVGAFAHTKLHEYKHESTRK